jgi:hypothetical protein
VTSRDQIPEAIEDFRAGRLRRALGAVVLGAFLALSGSSCATRSESRTDVDQHEYTTSVTIVANRAVATLQRGREAVSEGRFADGIAAFEAAYAMPEAKAEQREQALLALAQVHSNMLNPSRNPQKALAYYQQLLSEFPETKQRYEVERAMAELETKR